MVNTGSKIGLILLFVASASPSWAESGKLGRPSGGPPHEIPAEAYTACADKSEGDEVTDENGISGTCETMKDGRLALRPSGPPPGEGFVPRDSSGVR